MEWQTQDAIAIHSTSRVDKMTIDCFFELHVNVVSYVENKTHSASFYNPYLKPNHYHYNL